MRARRHLGGREEYGDATVRAFRELTDLEAIRALKARYFRYLDTKQWERLRGVFVDDLETDGFWAKGRNADEFVASLAENLKAVRSVHLGSTPEISILGPAQFHHKELSSHQDSVWRPYLCHDYDDYFW